MTLFQDPRAYVIGLEGVALLRAFCGDHDGEFTRQRMDELRALLHESTYVGEPFVTEQLTTVEGYAAWAPTYDLPGNGCFELDEPVIVDILKDIHVDQAVDVACGTGRLTGLLGDHARRVIGVDSSPDMLAIASRKWPAVTFLRADLEALPVPECSVDLILCTLALSHIPELSPVFAEFARALKPGGHLVLSDIRGFLDTIRPPTIWQRSDGAFGYLPLWVHRTSDYLTAALTTGFDVQRCEEPVRDLVPINDPSWQTAICTPPGEPPNVWQLMGWCPHAAHAAFNGHPGAIIWQFRRR